MIDINAFADRVSYLLKTKYAEVPSKDRPFTLAFSQVADESSVAYEKRKELKQEVGRNLRSRPGSGVKHSTTPESLLPKITMPMTKFTTVSTSRGEVILDTSWMGRRLTFRRNDSGNVLLCAYTGNPPDVIKEHARIRATELFAEEDEKAIDDVLIIFETWRLDEVIMRLGRSWRAVATRGKRQSVRLSCTKESGELVKQYEVPRPLVEDARAFARQYFKGAPTLTLPGM